jgi:hypothetical protein
MTDVIDHKIYGDDMQIVEIENALKGCIHRQRETKSVIR